MRPEQSEPGLRRGPRLLPDGHPHRPLHADLRLQPNHRLVRPHHGTVGTQPHHPPPVRIHRPGVAQGRTDAATRVISSVAAVIIGTRRSPLYQYGGTANGKRIDLDESVPYEAGTRVRIHISAESTNAPPPGSPQAILSLVGTMSKEEAESVLATSRELRRIDPKLWSDLH